MTSARPFAAVPRTSSRASSNSEGFPLRPEAETLRAFFCGVFLIRKKGMGRTRHKNMKRPILRAFFLRPHPVRVPAEKFAQKTPGMNWERQGGFPNAIRPEKTESCKKCEIRAADRANFGKNPHGRGLPPAVRTLRPKSSGAKSPRRLWMATRKSGAETSWQKPRPAAPAPSGPSRYLQRRNEAPAAVPRRRGRAAGGAPSYRKTGAAQTPQKIPTFARIARSSHHKTGGAMRLSGARPGRGAGFTPRRRGRPPGGFGSPKAKRALQKKCSPKCQLCVDSTRNFFQSWQRIQAS